MDQFPGRSARPTMRFARAKRADSATKPISLPVNGSAMGTSPAASGFALVRQGLAEAGAGKARSLKFPKGKDVVVGGSQHDCVYINHDGWLARYKILHKGSRQILDFILPGEVFGLPACLFERALYSVATITDVTVSPIPFDVLDDLFERDPALAKALFWSTAHEAAILGEHLVDAGRRSAYERVSHLLLELFVRMNRARSAGEVSFSVPLTQELIADALGLSTVHVNRTLRALREDKLVTMNGGAVTIVDFEALSLLSDFEKSYLGGAFAAPQPGGLQNAARKGPRLSSPNSLGIRRTA